ncbi:hypothetical protein CIB84_006548 [Bambusicola thoracicus]|uniref:Uncharacterized protein n=1 Tax=Bambusicola thoracicus TaxID=9083 RepID=A0A2P4T014_BAMTH|nr:hypothetical protein CIB84_011420 [Bambusicola thoracicus]POI29702.1 hypothetical protein CIB84_006548 [Bambusicola thoracicus]
MGDVDPPYVEKPGTGKASWNLLYHLGRLWPSFEHLDPWGPMEVLYKKSTELGLLLVMAYIWRNLRRWPKQGRSQILLAAPGTRCQNSSCKHCNLLRQLKANPALMEMYLKHVRHMQEDPPSRQEVAKSQEDGEENRDLSLHTGTSIAPR